MKTQRRLPADVPLPEFLQLNEGLVFKVAKKVHARLLSAGVSYMDHDDLEQEARAIMVRCYEKFDPSLGFAFSTYFMRAAFNDLTKLTAGPIKQQLAFGTFSMESVTGDDGDSINLEDSIAGDHAQPDEMLEAQQLLERFNGLSPLARLVLEVTTQHHWIEREWQVQRELRRQENAAKGRGGSLPNKVPSWFVADWLRRNGCTATTIEVEHAIHEVSDLQEELLHV